MKMVKINSIYGLILICFAMWTIANGDVLKTCEQTAGKVNFNASEFNGGWYEISRSDFNGTFEKDASCVEYKFSIGQVVITLRKNKDKKLEKAETLSGTFIPIVNSTASFNLVLAGKPNVTVKILETDYANYTIACGYVNSTSTGAWLLSRKNTLQDEFIKRLDNYKNTTAGFDKFATVLQDSKKCKSSGTELLPTLTFIIVAMILSMKF